MQHITDAIEPALIKPYLVRMRMISGERDNIVNVQTVYTQNDTDAFQNALRAETGDNAIITDCTNHATNDCSAAYTLVSAVSITDAELETFRKFSIQIAPATPE
jgi:hypothetical protein